MMKRLLCILLSLCMLAAASLALAEESAADSAVPEAGTADDQECGPAFVKLSQICKKCCRTGIRTA